MGLLVMATVAMKALLPGEFSWNKTTHDFDRVLRGQTYTYRFLFSNTGDQPVTITSVETNSSFATASFTTTPVKPLQSGFVEIRFTPITAGPALVSFKVMAGGSQPVATLFIKGEVMTPQEMKPGPNAGDHGTH